MPGAARAADAVHVVLRVHGHVEVHDGVDPGNVDAAAHDVGGHEHLHLRGAEAPERSLALALVAPGVHEVALEAAAAEHLRHLVHAGLRAAEHKHALRRVAPKQRLEQLQLLALRDGAQVLLHRVGRLPHARDLDRGRVLEHGVHGALDGGRDRGREEQGLSLAGQRGDDAPDAGPEAHVQHAVRLVQHEDLHVGEAQVAVLHEVEQAPGSGNQKVAAGLEPADLLVELRAAHHDDGRLARLLAHDGDDVLDLLRELARGGDYQRERPKRVGVVVWREARVALAAALARAAALLAVRLAAGLGLRGLVRLPAGARLAAALCIRLWLAGVCRARAVRIVRAVLRGGLGLGRRLVVATTRLAGGADVAVRVHLG